VGDAGEVDLGLEEDGEVHTDQIAPAGRGSQGV